MQQNRCQIRSCFRHYEVMPPFFILELPIMTAGQHAAGIRFDRACERGLLNRSSVTAREYLAACDFRYFIGILRQPTKSCPESMHLLPDDPDEPSEETETQGEEDAEATEEDEHIVF